MTSKFIQPLLKRLVGAKEFKNLSPVDVLTSLSELPYHSLNKALLQLKGTEGKRNLFQGLQLGGGLAGTSMGLDYLSDDQLNNKGLSSALGLLGLISPGAFRGGRAAAHTAKNFLDDVKNLTSKGVNVLSKDERNRKGDLIANLLYDKDSLLNNPVKNFSKLKNKEFRDNLLSIFKPSNTVEIDYLTNAAGGLEGILRPLENMAKQYGKTELSAGTIINPNIAKRVSPDKGIRGSLPDILGKMGYKRLYGETRPTKDIAPELNSALRKRFEALINRGPAEGAVDAATKNNQLIKKSPFFPFKFDTSKGEKIRMTHGRVATSGEYEGEFLPELGWRDLTPSQKSWFKSQNISGPRDYAELVDQAKAYLAHAQNAAKLDPVNFASNFKLPSLRTIFKSNKPFSFDYNLSAIAPNLAGQAM